MVSTHVPTPSRSNEDPAQTTPATAIASPLSVDALLCFSVYALDHSVARLYRPHLARLGLTYPQYLVLLSLWAEDGQKVGALGQRLHLDSNTLTPLLKRMEKSGLLRRQRNPEDERSVLVYLSEQGRALEASADGVARCVLDAMGGDVAELAALRDRLTTLRARIDAAAAE